MSCGERPDRGLDAPRRPLRCVRVVDHCTGEAWADAAPGWSLALVATLAAIAAETTVGWARSARNATTWRRRVPQLSCARM